MVAHDDQQRDHLLGFARGSQLVRGDQSIQGRISGLSEETVIVLAGGERTRNVPNVPLYGTNTTSRPALEVLFHAILFTRMAKFSSAKNLLQDIGGHWLQQMPASAVPESFAAAIGQRVPIGTPHCLAALFTGRLLSTGSTLVQYGTYISQLSILGEGKPLDVKTYHRNMRQRRYSARDQDILNKLVNKAVDWFKEKLKRLQKSNQYKRQTQAQVRAVVARNMKNHSRSILTSCLTKNDKNQTEQVFQRKKSNIQKKMFVLYQSCIISLMTISRQYFLTKNELKHVFKN